MRRPRVGSSVAALVLLACAAAAGAQTPPPRLPNHPRVQLIQIGGAVLARQAVVLLPTDYAAGRERYAVLYLLHGLTGSHRDWVARTNLLEYSADLPVIIVLPDAGDSWYSNSISDPSQKFEDYVARDVVDHVDANYRTLPYRQARFVAGLSMGGFGAFKLALKHPRSFAVAASFSGAFDFLDRQDSESIASLFGPPGSPARRENDVVSLIAGARPEDVPYFYLDCGTADRFLASNRAVAAALAERRFPYEYHEVVGAHEWEYWDRRLPIVLAVIRARLPKAAASPRAVPSRRR